MKKRAGFTLIELAIVLVIIGLLLAGVLKGQELINSAKVKNMASDFKNTQVFLYGYQDKFKTLPGDDHAADVHVGGVNATGGTQNGVIEGAWDASTGAAESFMFWQHVRLAGLAPGSTAIADATYPPHNVDGGRIGIQSITGFTAVTGMAGAYVICSGDILGKFAKQLDTTLDDGVGDTGSVRVVLTTTPSPGVAAPNDSTLYLVCMAF